MPDWPQNAGSPLTQTVNNPSLPRGTEQTPSQPQAAPQPQTTQTTQPQLVPDHEVGHVIPGAVQPVIPAKKTIFKTLVILIFVIVTIGVVSSGVYLYSYLNNPLRLVGEGFKELDTANSFSTNISFAESKEFGNTTLLLDYQRSQLLFSRAQIKITNLGNEPGHELLVLFIFRDNESYIQANYSEIDKIENELRLISPEILTLQTYQLTKPIIRGEKWLHVTISEDAQESRPQGGIEISEEKEKELNDKFINSIEVRSFERNYTKDGKKYYKIILGFKKEELVDFAETFKDLDLDINLKDINAVVKIVESVDSWNDDLVEILIEKESGNLYSLSLSLPKIPEDALSASVKESVEGKENISYFSELFSEKISEVVEPKDSTKLTYIGKAVFTNYNQAPSSERPAGVVEAEEFSRAFEQDLPFFLQIIFREYQQLPELYGPDQPQDVLPETNESPQPPTF